MPVSVHLPTRICVDSGVLHGDGRVDLADAITRASGRALKQARESVLAPRGGYVGVRLHCPMFSWSGDGLGQVSPTVQREIEELATSALLDAVASSGIFDFAQLGEECDPPFAGEATESLDADRHYAHFRIYAVPGYQGQGTALPVTAIDFDEPEVVEASGITKWEWIPVSTPGLGTIVIEAAQ